ncbi:hypothetical protein VNI00_017425 [Paramarasmius palmivorus]|uniref:Uncharacterized protein n=1 Tax=Paramarasmius palmivorus TaxID=297713 RepID=A0AAW0B659_9AGAR
MQTASTTIALRLNTLSINQQQAVRTVVETLIRFGLDENIVDILRQTNFMYDLLDQLSDLSDSDKEPVNNEPANSNEETTDDEIDSNKENSSGYSDMEILEN